VAIDPAALAASIARLERATAITGDGSPTGVPDPSGFVDTVVASADALFALSGVGLMFLDEDDALRYVAALRRRHPRAGERPGAARRGALPGQPGAARGRPHPRPHHRRALPLRRRDRRALGVRAVLGVPVEVAGIAVGTLNVYQDRPHDWPEDEIHALRAFARVLGSAFGALVWARRSDALTRQLQHALDKRVVVERAIGFLMAQRDIDAVGAFDVLRRAARSSRRTVGEIAAGVLGGEQPEVDAPSRSRGAMVREAADRQAGG
jgi:hypothetical protein